MNLNFDFDVLKKYKSHFEDGLYYDAIESLKEDLDPEDIDLINKTEDLKCKIQTLLGIIIEGGQNGEKQTKLLKRFKEFLLENYSWFYEYFRQNYDRNNIRHILNIGGVPVLPERNVSRTDILRQVRRSVENLANSDLRFLVIHGLIGCGKSSLATEALHTHEILQHFKDGVFWIMVGSDGKERIRSLQEDLNVRLQDRDPNLSSNSDIALIQLRQRYLETKQDCLIILDDVHSEDVVRYLDVGVKFLITTRDVNVIRENKSISDYIEVPDHFKNEESLQLFALSLNVDIDDLPKARIDKILKLCKGHPISVAVVSAELADHKDDLKKGSSERWNHYIKTLKHYRKNLNETSDKYMKNAINLAINSLSPRLKSCFEHFVIFPEDVNLRPEVLATVWGKDKTEAENIMAELRKKQLVVRYWNEALSTYVYGVHDLFLDYLKSKEVTSPDKIKSLHKNLLDKYLLPCLWNPSKLPQNDNYIFYYLGHHLLAAGFVEKFPQIYTDLEFLEAKLRAVEPFDLVLDFHRYNSFISNEKNKHDVAELKDFIEWYGPYVHKGLDIAQLALQEPKSTFVYSKGKKLSEKRMTSNQGYIDFPLQHVERREWLPRTINMRDKQVTALCFDQSSNIVIATKGGSLELWNTNCIRLKMFTGHTDDITHLATSSTSKLYSSSNDSTIREWKLDNDNNSEDMNDLSPERTQDWYHDFWSSAKRGVEASEVLELPGAVLWVAVNDFNIAAVVYNHGSLSTELMLFRNYNVVKRMEFPGLKVCEFSRDGLFVITGGLRGVQVVSTETFMTRTPIERPVIGLSTLLNGTSGGLVTISKDRVDFWGDQTVKVVDGHHFTKPIEEKGAKYSLFHIGHHIALVTEKNDILILDSDTGRTLKFISGEYMERLTAIAIKQGMILTAYSNNKIEIKPIDIVDVPISKIFWPLSQRLPVVAKIENSTDLRVVKGNETRELFISAAPVNNLSMSYFESCQIVYSTNWGNVFLLDARTKEQIELDLFAFTCPTTVLEIFKHKGRQYVVASTVQDELKILDISYYPYKIYELGAMTIAANLCYLTQTGELVLSTLDSVQVWDFASREILYKFDNKRLLAVNESKCLMVISSASEVSVLEVGTGKALWSRSEEECKYVSISPDGEKLAFLSGPTLYVKHFNYLQMSERIDVYELPRFTSCRSYSSCAVSDDGAACVSTSQPCVYVASRSHGVICAAVQVSSLVSSSDSFAAIDKLGSLIILKPVNLSLNNLNITDSNTST